MMTDWSKSAYPRTCEELEKAGIDPANVLVDGLSTQGYQVFVLSATGQKSYDSRGGAIVSLRKWPDELTKSRVLATYELEVVHQTHRAILRTSDDLVNHPPHYQGHPKGIECIDVIEDMPYPNLANVIKYAWRVAFGGKWDDIEDLKKIVWYANREIERRSKA